MWGGGVGGGGPWGGVGGGAPWGVVGAVAGGWAQVVPGKAAAVVSWVVKMVDTAATAVGKAVAVAVGKARPEGVGGEKGGCSSIRPTGSNRP